MSLLRRAAVRRPAGRPLRQPRADRRRRGAAVRAGFRRRAACRRDSVADRHPLPEPPGRSRDREPLRDRNGRAAGEGRGVLPRQLRRLADQAGAELRRPVRGVRRHAEFQRGRQPGAARVRVCRALALRPAARRRAHRPDGAHRSRPRAADPAPAAARRRARRSERARIRARRRQHREHGNDPRVRRRAPGGRRAPLTRCRPEAQVAALVGLPQPAHRRARLAAVGAGQRSRPVARRRPRRRQSRDRGDHRRLYVLLQRDAHHVRVQPDLPPPGELADGGRAVHGIAAHATDRDRPGRARGAADEGEATSASSG